MRSIVWLLIVSPGVVCAAGEVSGKYSKVTGGFDVLLMTKIGSGWTITSLVSSAIESPAVSSKMLPARPPLVPNCAAGPPVLSITAVSPDAGATPPTHDAAFS